MNPRSPQDPIPAWLASLTGRYRVCLNCRCLQAAEHPCGNCGADSGWVFAHPLLEPVSRCDADHWNFALEARGEDNDSEASPAAPPSARKQTDWQPLSPAQSRAYLTAQGLVEVRWLPERGVLRFDAPAGEELPVAEALAGRPRGIRVRCRGRLQGGTAGPAPLSHYAPGEVRIAADQTVTLGRGLFDDPRAINIPAEDVAWQHCALVARKPQDADGYQVYLADLGTRTGTFVNRRPVSLHRLTSGDFLQIAGYAWTYLEEEPQAAEHCGVLIPAAKLGGHPLQLGQVEVPDRLRDFSAEIGAGELVALVGPSGSGKSTLLKAVLGAPGTQVQGQITVAGLTLTEQRQAYRNCLAYLPQNQIIHDDLPARDAVTLAARLRNGPAASRGRQSLQLRVHELLRRLDLPRRRWSAPARHLSGGELKRVCLAAELIAEKGLLLLDEPASGLDQQREQSLMKLLRGLSYQGVTILLVTHGVAHLQECDRVLVVADGSLRFDGTPAQLRQQAPGGQLDALDLPAVQPAPKTNGQAARQPHPCPPSPPSRQPPADNIELAASEMGLNRKRVDTGRTTFWSQAALLWQRQWQLMQHAMWRRVVLPLAVVPAIFAAALGLGIPSESRDLLGFFSIMAVIWMGASLSLLSVVRERDVLEHEWLLFLRLPAYLLAKWSTLILLSTLQTASFFLLLSLIRWQLEAAALLRPATGFSFLVLAGWAALGLGLALSTLSKHNAALANFLLPLLMMFQIVWTAQVGGAGARTENAPLKQAYGDLHFWPCEGLRGCPRRVEIREPSQGEFLCHRCRHALLKVRQQQTSHDSANQAGAGAVRRVSALERAAMEQQLDVESPADVQQSNRERTPGWLVLGSYFTLSRYADFALRSCCYREQPQTRGWDPWLWHCDATLPLAAWILAFPLASWLTLSWQLRHELVTPESLARLRTAPPPQGRPG